MDLEVNGEAMRVPEGLTIEGLLDHLKISRGRIAVEINRELVRRDAHAAHRLSPGDHVEIVAFVGGG
jgi:sulfur carrier protein